MNDEYAKHIVQKYRLAVAIAIVKNTPENSTPKQYLELLRNKMNTEMEANDSDMTICEDDFNFDDDENYTINKKDENTSINDLEKNNDTLLDNLNDSVTILKDFNFNDMMQNMNNAAIENDSVSDVLRILRGAEDDEVIGIEDNGDANNLNHTQSTFYESCHSQKQANNSTNEIEQIQYNINDTSTCRNTSVICLENTYVFDSHPTNSSHGYTDNFTHISQSQVNDIVVARCLIEKEKSKNNKSKLVLDQVEKKSEGELSKTPQNVNRSEIINPTKQVDGKYVNDISIIHNIENKKHKNNFQENKNIDDIKAKRFKNIDNKHSIHSNKDSTYSNEIKSKFDMSASGIYSEINFNMNSKTEHNKFLGDFFVKINNNNTINSSSYDHSEIPDTDLNKDRKDLENDKRNRLDIKSQTSLESKDKTSKINYNSQSFSQFSQEFSSENSNNETEAFVNASNSSKLLENIEHNEQEQIIENLFDKLTDSQAEVVPFKVIEELNKVKSYLNKRNKSASSECVSDSGYKSDSQSRSSFKTALQNSNIWLNQSAYCLLNYITSCPLVVNTHEITDEISRTLGRLIDRLHDDEKYPSFLEEHLQTVDRLLKEIYEEESADKLLQKDENIHRIFLLNKSQHIIKYTTERITAILEDLLSILNEEELLETSRTVQTENLSYIFHILETLIKKLVIHKNFSSQQSTQNSQEETLKKSSITEIWRRKWNPNKKFESNPTSGKQCILVKTSEILNKIIVQAMDGYSLISYFALQCFNLLQN